MARVNPEAAARLSRLRAFLDQEEREVRARADALLQGKTAKEIEASGALLRRARIGDVKSAMFGRVRVTVVDDPSRPGHVDRFEVRPGAVVLLMERDDDGRMSPVADGVVVRRSRGRLEVVFDASEQVGDVDDSVDLLRGEDEVTLRRMKEGLAAAERAEGRTARLLEIVLGATPPRPTRPGELATLDALNEDQRVAAHHGVMAEDVALIHGPPGTGKTRVLVEVVRQCVTRGERVLALTASNAAIDHLALSLLNADAGLPLARLGNPARVSPALEQHTLVALTDSHERRQMARELVEQAFTLLRQARKRSARGRDAWQKEREARVEAGKLFADARRLALQAAEDVLRKARVLCGTLTGLSEQVLPPSDEPDFDVLVVDEASQALTPALLLGLRRARRLVLAGDHKQLPPTVISPRAAKEGLADTVFASLCAGDRAGAVSHMLTVQHRMHEALMGFPSARFYGAALRAHPSVAQHTLVDLGLVDEPLGAAGRVLDVVDTAGTGFEERQAAGLETRENEGEARLVERVLRALLAGGLGPEQVGVITPYAGQVAVLSAALAPLVDAGLEIDSVDGFQGREKELILISAVRSNAEGEVGFLADARRLNVAITRARRKLVVVGDSATLSADEHWRALFDHAIAVGAYRSAFELPE
jgi:superfamily I DNA and/or RNA helicase